MSALDDRGTSQHNAMLGFVIVGADLLSILCAGQLTNVAYHTFILNVTNEAGRGFGYGLGVAGIFVLVAMHSSEYTLARIATPSGKRLAWHWMVSLSLFLAAVFVLKVGDVFSRGAFLIFAITGAATLIVNRHLITLALNKGLVRGLLQPQRCALVGEAADIERARQQFEKSSSDIAITESIEISGACDSKAFSGGMNRVMSLSREHAIDSIVIALPWSRSSEIKSALELLRQQALPVILLPDVQASQFISEPSI